MLRILAWTLGIFVLLVAAAVAALFLVDWNILRGYAEDAASAAVGREVKIGHLDVDPGWTTRITVRDLQIANAEWSEGDPLAAVERAEISIRVPPLLRGDTVLPEVSLDRPVLNLLRDAQERANWDLSPAAEAAGEVATPDDRAEFPVVGRFVVRDGRFTYRDDPRELDLDATIATAAGDADGDDRIAVGMQGTLAGRPLNIEFEGGSVFALRENESPYPFDLELTFGETRVAAEGTATDPVALRDMDVRLEVSGPTLAEVFPIFGIPLPETPAYSLAGALSREGDVWRFSDFDGKVGDSDLSGSLEVDQGREKPFLRAELTSSRLDIADLAGLVGATPGEAEPPDDGGVIPDREVETDRLHAMDMDVRFDGKQVITEGVPVDALSFRIRVENGRAVAAPLVVEIAGGRISGEMALNDRSDPPSADAKLDFENLDLAPFFAGSQFMEQMQGRFGGRIDLLGNGRSLHQVLSTSNGSLLLTMHEGTLSALLIEAAGLDLIEALGLLVQEDVRVAIRCGRIAATVTDGMATIDEAIVDTTDSVLGVRGRIHFGKEAVDIYIQADSKDFSLVELDAPVRVQGPMRGPSIAIGGFDFLPFLEMGDADDIDCAALLAGQGPKPVPKPAGGG